MTFLRRLQQTNPKLGDLSSARTVRALEHKSPAAAEPTPALLSAAVCHLDSESGSQCPHCYVSEDETMAGL